eukprot:COSAG02_NODE_48327_length_334_cov_1.093617_1_plen_40_part_10
MIDSTDSVIISTQQRKLKVCTSAKDIQVDLEGKMSKGEPT